MRIAVKKELSVAIAYALLYVLTRDISVSHWQLSSGLRFVALLFAPYRFWPWIIAADCGGSMYYRADRIQEFGILWFVLTVTLPVLSAAAPVATLRLANWLSKEARLSAICLKLLKTAGAASVFTAISGVVAMHAITYSAKDPAPREGPIFYLCDFTLGNYIGILMLAPFVMTLMVSRKAQFKAALEELTFFCADHAPAVMATCGTLLGLLLINRESHSGDIQHIAAILMFAPAVWMTFTRGWTGAVITTIFANVALQLTMRGYRDVDLLQMQTLLGLIATAMLMLGAIITESRLRVSTLSKQQAASQGLARMNISWNESRLRYTASVVERALIRLQSYVDDATLQLRTSGAHEAGAMVRWQGSTALRNDLRNTIAGLDLQPLETRGLRVAIIYGHVAQALEEAGITFSVRVTGKVDELPFDMQRVVCRLAHDLAMHMAKAHSAYRITARIRAYQTEQMNIAVVVKACPSFGDEPKIQYAELDLSQVEGTALTFGGIYHNRTRRRLPTIGVVLRDV